MATVPSWPVMPSTNTLVGTSTVVSGTTESLPDRARVVNCWKSAAGDRW
jgi:hypothetical protein